MNKDITYIGHVSWRNDQRRFGILENDRFSHLYILGKTGTGKSTLIYNMLMQDIDKGKACALLDPHGDLVEKVFKNMPQNRINDVIYFNIPDINLNLKYNPFKSVSREKRSLVASGILDVFAKLWKDAWGVKLEHILRFSILTLLDQPTATIADLPELLLNKSFRIQAITNVENESVIKFFQREFREYNKYDLLPVLNKLGGILAHPVIKRVLVSNEKEISLRKAMDEGKIILVNLSKGHLGADVSNILGSLFITSIASASFSRVDTEEHLRKPFFAYLDEFQNFTTLSLVNMLSELRKFKVGMTLAHQYLHQLDDKVYHSIIGNVGSMICFRLGSEDALRIAKEYYPDIEMIDLINMPNYKMYIKLLIKGKGSMPFSGITFSKL